MSSLVDKQFTYFCPVPRGRFLRSLILELNNAHKRTIFLVNFEYEDNLSIKSKGHVGVTSIVGIVNM